jgi:hypothetical protein
MKFYQVDPIKDGRWAELVERHHKASVFHSVGWLKALQQTYGYTPITFTTSSPTEELKNGLLFCQVNSWLTGRRLVSLPFSDHCEPLCDSGDEINSLMSYAQGALDRQACKYVEIRPISEDLAEAAATLGFRPAGNYFLHVIDLRANLDDILRSFDRDSVQRRIQRAARAGLVERCGTSNDLLNAFYGLLVTTRCRHRVPPPPYAWFQSLIRWQGKALEIRVAYFDDVPIAAILTLRSGRSGYFKYGCSDVRFNKFGATPWLLWKAISAAKSDGALGFDMGRTQAANSGLLAFKNHWVPQPKRLVYWKFPNIPSFDSHGNWKLGIAQRIFSLMPEKLLAISGRLIYRHIG